MSKSRAASTAPTLRGSLTKDPHDLLLCGDDDPVACSCGEVFTARTNARAIEAYIDHAIAALRSAS